MENAESVVRQICPPIRALPAGFSLAIESAGLLLQNGEGVVPGFGLALKMDEPGNLSDLFAARMVQVLKSNDEPSGLWILDPRLVVGGPVSVILISENDVRQSDVGQMRIFPMEIEVTPSGQTTIAHHINRRLVIDRWVVRFDEI